MAYAWKKHLTLSCNDSLIYNRKMQSSVKDTILKIFDLQKIQNLLNQVQRVSDVDGFIHW